MYETELWAEGYGPLGTFPRSLVRVHAEWQAPYSHAWFCPDCGEVWAKAETYKDPESLENEKFTIEGGQCAKHPGPSPYHVPGTMLLAWDEEFNQLLLSCPDAVKREFELHLKFAERSLINE